MSRKNMKIIILSFFICLLSSAAAAESVAIEYDNGDYIVYDHKVLFLFDSERKVLHMRNSVLREKEVSLIAQENLFSVVNEGELYFYHYDNEELRCIWPAENNMPIVSLPYELTYGNYDCQFRSMHMQNGCLTFLLYTERETPFLCRYDSITDTLAWLTVDGMTTYFLDEQNTAYAVVQTEQITSVFTIDWAERQSIVSFRLNGRYEAFAADEASFFAANLDDSTFVIIQNGEIVKSGQSPYAASLWEGAFVDGRYWVFGPFGLYSPDFIETQQSSRTLRLLKSGADDLDCQFLLQHPDVQFEFISSTAYEGTDLCEAIVSGELFFDVGTISNVQPAADALLRKGYTFDLSASTVLREKAQCMYAPVQRFVFDGEKLMFFPVGIFINNLIEIQEKSVLRAGLAFDHLPQTFEEFLDLLIAWDDSHGYTDNNEDIVPFLFEDPPHGYMLNMLFREYIASYRRAGKDLDFDTPEFRALLDKVKRAADISPVQSENYHPAQLFVRTGRTIPSPRSCVFTITANETPCYEAQINGYMIHARTSNPDLALRYVEFRAQKEETSETALQLLDKTHHAEERADFSSFMNTWLAERECLERALAREESAPLQREIQEKNR